jgi:hypothetical protein
MKFDYVQLIEKILSHYAGSQFADEVRIAKREFFDSSSIFDESSPHFELRMSQFFDWYFFSRELRGIEQTPLDSALLPRELKYTPNEIEHLETLRRHRHSLFEFIKIKNSDVYIKDLLADKKLVVKNSPFTIGFSEEEVFEVRLIPVDDSWTFSKGFCFHPAESKKYILSEVKKYRKNTDLNPEELMLRLIKMRYKFEQYRHVPLGQIYCNDSRLGV